MHLDVGPLAQRTMSSFALSIGTALAFESLFKGDQPPYDPLREIPQQVNIRDYEEYWVNLGTLVRNIYSSVPANVQNDLMAVDMYVTMESEIDIIRSLVSENSNGHTKLVLYRTDHSRLRQRHPHAKFRLEITDKQKMFGALRDSVLDEWIKRHSHVPGNHAYFEKLVPGYKKKTLIMTHDAYDLLSWPSFGELHLLESHTGLLKRRPLWYTKLHNGKDLMRIPFNACFMQLFGDSVHFHPFPMKDRELIKSTAVEREWTQLTTRERLMYSLEQLPDKVLGKLLLEMLSE